jgi:hypothetical protein
MTQRRTFGLGPTLRGANGFKRVRRHTGPHVTLTSPFFSVHEHTTSGCGKMHAHVKLLRHSGFVVASAVQVPYVPPREPGRLLIWM